jgi:hypothetical protein
MQKIHKIKFVLIFILLANKILAQESPVSSGGNIINSEGSVSFTIGQIFYSSNSFSNITVEQGIQHAYSIVPLVNDEFISSTLNIQVFPIPTIDKIKLNIKDIDLTDFNYSLFNINGQLISKSSITLTESTIDMQNLPSGIYLLKISRSNFEIKKFNIIKK